MLVIYNIIIPKAFFKYQLRISKIFADNKLGFEKVHLNVRTFKKYID